MKKMGMLRYTAILSLLLILAGCRDNAVPKPRGYFRIDLPQKQYLLFDTTCPFSFEYPAYSKISYDTGDKPEPCWFNIEFPGYRAKIHISYRQVNNNLEPLIRESFDYAYSHTVKADAISETPWYNPGSNVYGMLYDIKGNAASSVQFFVTDSTRHFMRGALYFMTQPEKDSLAPVIDFFRQDIVHMVETFKWKNK